MLLTYVPRSITLGLIDRMQRKFELLTKELRNDLNINDRKLVRIRVKMYNKVKNKRRFSPHYEDAAFKTIYGWKYER